MGSDGYENAAQQIMKSADAVCDAIREMPELELMGARHFSVVCFRTQGKNSHGEDLSIHAIADAMSSRGWSLNILQYPECIHLCLTYCHVRTGADKTFLVDLKD